MLQKLQQQSYQYRSPRELDLEACRVLLLNGLESIEGHITRHKGTAVALTITKAVQSTSERHMEDIGKGPAPAI